jgi:hypothetical protein
MTTFAARWPLVLDGHALIARSPDEFGERIADFAHDVVQYRCL